MVRPWRASFVKPVPKLGEGFQKTVMSMLHLGALFVCNTS
jgi:hypothetical protein